MENPSDEFYTFGSTFLAFQVIGEMCSYFLDKTVADYFGLGLVETINLFALIVNFPFLDFQQLTFKGLNGRRKLSVVCPLVEYSMILWFIFLY